MFLVEAFLRPITESAIKRAIAALEQEPLHEVTKFAERRQQFDEGRELVLDAVTFFAHNESLSIAHFWSRLFTHVAEVNARKGGLDRVRRDFALGALYALDRVGKALDVLAAGPDDLQFVEGR